MKQLYAILLLSSTQFLNAQSGQPAVPPHTPAESPFQQSELLNLGTTGSGDRAVLWSEDFGSGFPAGWTRQDLSGICPWVWSTDGSWGFFNGNSGTAGGTAIASTTGANGFLICDPDSANNVTYGQPSGTTYQYLSSHFTTSAIDMSAHPHVRLEFEQFFRYNNTPTLDVSVSNDSVNWTTWNVRGTVQPNAASPNAQTVRLNVSSVAGGQPTVYIRIGWNARVYYWMIDDIRITDAPADDMRLAEVNYSEWFWDTAPDFGALEYSVYPTSQLRPLTFKGRFTNEGFEAQTGVQLTAAVSNASSTVVHTSTGNLATLPVFGQDSIYPTPWTPAASTGNYTVEFTLTADDPDDDPSDNVLSKSYAISQYVFARDRGVVNGRYSNEGDAYDLGNWFHIVNGGDVLYGIDVAIHNTTPEGVLITGTLYDANRDPIATTQEYEVQASDLNANGGSTFVTLPFAVADRPTLLAGSDYLAMVNHFGGASDLFMGVSGTSLPQTSLIYDVPVATWFYVTSTPMVRMNMNPAVGERELTNTGAQGMSLMPVPANEQATIILHDMIPGAIELVAQDAQGRQVWHSGPMNVQPGTSRIMLNTSNWPAGAYLISCLAGDTRQTQRLFVVH
ncbi:MAG: hypothetical protein JNM31_11610 [Flavobacteriales bacterium]|nr:hypothetical protein [Flavobacteriales bacterium]